jgi:uncharacterized protein DUF1580
MIDIGRERLLTLAEATKLIPGRFGKKLSIKTIHRWALHGVRGVQLETVKMGGRKMTSVGAIQRFGYALTLSLESQSPTTKENGSFQLNPCDPLDQKAVDDVLSQAGIFRKAE